MNIRICIAMVAVLAACAPAGVGNYAAPRPVTACQDTAYVRMARDSMARQTERFRQLDTACRLARAEGAAQEGRDNSGIALTLLLFLGLTAGIAYGLAK